MEVIDLANSDDESDEALARRLQADEVVLVDEEVQCLGAQRRMRKAVAGRSAEDEAARKRKREEEAEDVPAMRRGAAAESPLDAAEDRWARLPGDNARSRFLRKVVAGIGREALDDWRWKRDRPDEPLWDVLAACSDAFPRADLAPREGDEEAVAFLRRRLAMYAARGSAAAEIDKIEPVEAGGVDCGVCCDAFLPGDAVPCEGDGMHWFCRSCLRQYVTVTVAQQSGASASAVKCPACDALVATAHVKGLLSAWELDELESRAAERDRAVALKGGAVASLECECGARGVVLAGDEPADGVIDCPGCERKYCIKCGNDAHGSAPCPPSSAKLRLLAALGPDTKLCPNCGNGITKSEGCNHVLCAPPGGCGKGFCFICLQPHESHDPAKCSGGAQAQANMQAHNPAQEAEIYRANAEARLAAKRAGLPQPQIRYAPVQQPAHAPPPPMPPQLLAQMPAALRGYAEAFQAQLMRVPRVRRQRRPARPPPQQMGPGPFG